MCNLEIFLELAETGWVRPWVHQACFNVFLQIDDIITRWNKRSGEGRDRTLDETMECVVQEMEEKGIMRFVSWADSGQMCHQCSDGE